VAYGDQKTTESTTNVNQSKTSSMPTVNEQDVSTGSPLSYLPERRHSDDKDDMAVEGR